LGWASRGKKGEKKHVPCDLREPTPGGKKKPEGGGEALDNIGGRPKTEKENAFLIAGGGKRRFGKGLFLTKKRFKMEKKRKRKNFRPEIYERSRQLRKKNRTDSQKKLLLGKKVFVGKVVDLIKERGKTSLKRKIKSNAIHCRKKKKKGEKKKEHPRKGDVSLSCEGGLGGGGPAFGRLGGGWDGPPPPPTSSVKEEARSKRNSGKEVVFSKNAPFGRKQEKGGKIVAREKKRGGLPLKG